MDERAFDRPWHHFALLVAVLCCFITPAVMVKHENFKTCAQSGFCQRNRDYADAAKLAGTSWTSPYHLDGQTLTVKEGQLTGTLLKEVDENTEPVRLPLIISFLQSGSVRIEVNEERRMRGDIELRHASHARKERYNEAPKWALVGGLELGSSKASILDADRTVVEYGPEKSYQAIIHHRPFRVDFVRDGEVHVKLNGDGLMNMEHWRPKIDQPAPEVKDGDDTPAAEPVVSAAETTEWDETFGGNTDTKPRGPESIGLDVTFPAYEHVFGIPEHAGSLSLKETRGGPDNYEEPYRLYNADVFEYELDSPMTLYGAIPLMHAHRKGSTVGVFWLNAAETWIDIVKTKQDSSPLSFGIGAKVDTHTHWFSESGVLDVFVFLGPTPKDVVQSYSQLTGTTQLPQQFAIAYHQCRWNYVTDEDVRDVDKKFDRANIPYDVIWLDIEYTDGKKYFTWESQTFVDPIGMGKQLDEHQRKLVTIIDPHIKNEGGYHVVDELKSQSLAVKGKDNTIFEGWCWPGSSHWVDTFNPAARKWWAGLFAYSSFKGTAANTFIWNDMNEPSVFNGPETTMPKDNLHFDNWEHRDVHNLMGMTFHNATAQALAQRDPKSPKRPFVLTRAFFAGSQRLGAMWTGDNLAEWSHLAIAFPMILAQNIAGFPFAGADVGGFFGNPSKELLTRWYQAGIFYPFFRAHAHIDTRRREPYLAGDPYTGIITQALRTRYQLLPAWYTAFHEASVTGQPIVRPNFYVHPDDERGFAIDDQLYLGDTGLLAKPVVTEGAEHVDVYLADDEPYYDYFDYTIISGAGATHRLAAPLAKIPLLMQGGHIIPRKDRPRRSSGLMRWDPYTLVVVLDKAGHAEGTLYVDDGETFDYREGASIHRRFAFDGTSGTLTSTDLGKGGKKAKEFLKTMAGVTIERIIVVGAPTAWKGKEEVTVTEEASPSRTVRLTWTGPHDGKAAWAVVRNPGVGVGVGWKLQF